MLADTIFFFFPDLRGVKYLSLLKYKINLTLFNIILRTKLGLFKVKLISKPQLKQLTLLLRVLKQPVLDGPLRPALPASFRNDVISK